MLCPASAGPATFFIDKPSEENGTSQVFCHSSKRLGKWQNPLARPDSDRRRPNHLRRAAALMLLNLKQATSRISAFRNVPHFTGRGTHLEHGDSCCQASRLTRLLAS